MKNPPEISIVSPVYRAEGMVADLVRRVSESVETITPDFEIILVEDASPDNSWNEILRETENNQQVKGIRLSRNFGQHYAITAGIEASSGTWVIVMDCDLQDLPEEIPKLYEAAQSGFEVVRARRRQRKDHFLKRMTSILFYRVLSYLTGTKHDHEIANFGIYHRKVIDAVGQMKDSIRYFPTMISWVGFKSTSIPVEHGGREVGKSSYNLKRLIRLALDIILAFSDKPLRLTVKLGLTIAGLSFLFGIVEIIRYLLGYITVIGYASLITSIWFLSGIVIFILGIVGLYVGKIFESVKGRPRYIVTEKTWNP